MKVAGISMLLIIQMLIISTTSIYAVDYRIEEYTETPPELTVPEAIYDDVAEMGGSNISVNARNSSEQYVGNAWFWVNYREYLVETPVAFIWDPVNRGNLIDSPHFSYAYDINESGQVAGSSAAIWRSSSDAVIWDSTNGMQDLGNLGYKFGGAHGINDFGWVVGRSAIPDSYATDHAFVWNSQEGMIDLNSFLPDNSG